MCLLLLSYRQHPLYPFVLATNRDEFYARPTAPMHFWDDAPDVLAGRDLQGGGTWLGVTRHGRFAALTNYRSLADRDPAAPSRGHLVSDFLLGDDPPAAYLARLAPAPYNGFNLLVGDATGLWYLSNRSASAPRRLGPGLFGLSNHLLDSPWPKVERGKAALQTHLETGDLDPDALLVLLADDARAPDDALPDTGVGLAWERVLSPLFIATEGYGTRCSTILRLDAEGQAVVTERTHRPGTPPEDRRFVLALPACAPA